MATPLNVSASGPERHSASMEMQTRSLVVVESGDAQIDITDAAAGVTQVHPSVSLGGGAAASRSPAPSDASKAEADKLMLDAIAATLQQGPKAVVDAMLEARASPSPGADDPWIQRYIPDLPLSAACAMDQGLAVISALLQAFPSDVRKKDGKEMLPLHWAAEYNSNEAVVAVLLKAYSDAAREKDQYGLLPLHFAAKRSSNEAVVAVLLKAYPDAAREKDQYGLLPLHFAAKRSSYSSLGESNSRNTNSAVITVLLKAYPDAAREKNKDGELPLHLRLADRYNPNVADIAELLKAYPDALHEKNRLGINLLQECLPALTQMGDLPSKIMELSTHPLKTSIQLSAALMVLSRKQRSKDIRLADGADEKAAELEQLACAIARNVTDKKHLGQEMDDCLELAADLKLKFFISEPTCSRRIEKLWYNDKIGFVIIIIWLFLNIIYDWLEAIPPPMLRFLMNRASYLAFLVCLLQLPLQAPDDAVPSIRLEIFLAYWLFDICFSEAVEFRGIKNKHRLTFLQTIAKYADDPWNIYDVISLSAAVAAAFVRGVVHAGVGDATAAASNQLYAWALALLWGRLVNVLSVVSFIGPLLIMVLVMVFRDLSKFAFLVVLMELPFVAALYFLESGNGGNEAFATFSDSALSFFKIVIGQGPEIGSVTASSSILLSIGSVLLSVLLLNLLIAMFSKTFDTIVENSTQEFLLQKAQLTFAWKRAPRLPPPLASPVALRDWVMSMVARHLWRNETFGQYFAGWKEVCDPYGDDSYVDAEEEPLPTFDRLHFYRIVFAKRPVKDIRRSPSELEIWKAYQPQYLKDCEAAYNAWCKQVLEDWVENAEFNSEAQMDKFKSRMLRGMETTVESSGKIDQIKSQMVTQEHKIAESAKATQEQVNALSEAVQSQRAQIQQMHDSIQLILQKLSS
jgi:ankyrin repeat protein/uncharacterized coiled-coil protein SlyX